MTLVFLILMVLGPVLVSNDITLTILLFMLHIINESDCCCHSVNIFTDPVKLVRYYTIINGHRCL